MPDAARVRAEGRGRAAEGVRVLVADDEPLARAALVDVLEADPRVAEVLVAEDGIQAAELIAREPVDVVFLDLRMPELGGLEIAERLATRNGDGGGPAIVFVTAYQEFAVRAFEVHAADYVLKPFAPERVHSALTRAVERSRDAGLRAALAAVQEVLGRAAPARSGAERATPDAGAPAAPPAAAVRPPYLERFAVTSVGRIRVIDVADVEWIEADDNYARLHTTTRGGGGLVRETLSALERMLDPERFLRVHRSAIVRLDRLREIRTLPGGEGELHLASGVAVPLGRTYREQLLRRLRTSP